MTIEQFLSRLARTPRTWQVTDTGALRNQIQCPLEAVAYPDDMRLIDPFGRKPDYLYRMTGPLRAARALRMTVEDAQEIIAAADDLTNIDHGELRRKLLRACGL